MNAIVVYESMYGNTAAMAETIASSLRAQGLEVDAGPISMIGTGEAARVDLVVVGGPTHAQRLGYRLVVGPECFLVSTKNRLLEGQIDHAVTWGADVALRVTASVHPVGERE